MGKKEKKGVADIIARQEIGTTVESCLLYYQKKHMKKIAIIIPYFGNLPNYFDLWLRSAEKNDIIDFILLTDNPIESSSHNIIVMNCKFEDVVKRIRAKFPFEVQLRDPYDLCTFKPAYGYIFDDLLNEYDFWGHCDVDLIFGDLKKFITDNILQKHDKIFSHGHLCLYKNSPVMNHLFMTKRPDCIYYKDAFSSRKIWNNFDEYPYGVSRIAKQSNIKVYEAPVFADIDSFFYTFRKIYSYLDKKDDSADIRQYFSWENGKLYDVIIGENSKEELAYVHFQKRKMDVCHLQQLGDSYLIAPNIFLPTEQQAEAVERASSTKLNAEYSQKIQSERKIVKVDWKHKYLSVMRWKRKLFLLKMKYIYKVEPYKFIQGGF